MAGDGWMDNMWKEGLCARFACRRKAMSLLIGLGDVYVAGQRFTLAGDRCNMGDVGSILYIHDAKYSPTFGWTLQRAVQWY